MPACCTDPINHTRVRLQKCAICGGLILDGEPITLPERPPKPDKPEVDPLRRPAHPAHPDHDLPHRGPHPDHSLPEPDEPDLKPEPHAKRRG